MNIENIVLKKKILKDIEKVLDEELTSCILKKDQDDFKNFVVREFYKGIKFNIGRYNAFSRDKIPDKIIIKSLDNTK